MAIKRSDARLASTTRHCLETNTLSGGAEVRQSTTNVVIAVLAQSRKFSAYKRYAAEKRKMASTIRKRSIARLSSSEGVFVDAQTPFTIKRESTWGTVTASLVQNTRTSAHMVLRAVCIAPVVDAITVFLARLAKRLGSRA